MIHDKNIKPTPMKLVKMLGYQEGAVVSREIIKKTTGTVTLFAFDQGEGLSEHTTPFAALVLILDGEAKITIDGVGYTLETGEAIIMPAGHPHELKAVKRFKMMLTMIRS